MKKSLDPFDTIKKELSNYDISILIDFMDKFPPTTRTYFLPIYEIGKKKNIIIKHRSVGMTTLLTGYDVNIVSPTWITSFLKVKLPKYKVTKKYIIFSSVEDFWQRWQRFKNLMAFL